MKTIEIKYEILSYFNTKTKQDVEPSKDEHLYLVIIDKVYFVVHTVDSKIIKELNFKDNIGFVFNYINKPNVILKY